MVKLNYSVQSIVYTVIVSAIMGWYFMTSIRALASTPVFAVILALFLLIYVIPYRRIAKVFYKLQVFQIAFAFIVGIIAYNFNYKEMLEIYMITLIVFSPFFIFLSIRERGNIDEAKLISYIMFGMIMYVLFFSFNAMGENVRALRAVTSGTTDEATKAMLIGLNVGNSQFSYLIGMLTPLFAAAAISVKDKRLRIIYASIAVLFFIFVVKSQFTLLLLMTVSSLLLTFLFKKKRTKGVIFIILIGMVISSIILTPIILTVLLYFTEGTLTGVRILGLLNVVSGDLLIVDLTSRVDRIYDALNLFIHNPIFGADQTDSLYYSINMRAHSLLCSILCMSGLLGFACYYKINNIIYRELFSKELQIYIVPQLFCLIFAYILNSAFSDFLMHIVYIMLLPMFSYINLKQPQKNKI